MNCPECHKVLKLGFEIKKRCDQCGSVVKISSWYIFSIVIVYLFLGSLFLSLFYFKIYDIGLIIIQALGVVSGVSVISIFKYNGWIFKKNN